MFRNKKVIVCIPAGRKNYLSVLIPYLVRERGLVDECRIWKNTYDADDIEYIHAMVMDYAPWMTLEEPQVGVDRLGWGWSIYPFFKRCIEPGVVYVRIDDDVVWLEAGALRQLIRFRVDNPGYFLVLGEPD